MCTFCHQIEQELGVSLLMINIDECLIEKALCEASCTNFLTKSNVPSAVYTNTTSFVGVRAVVDPVCTCTVPEPLVCLNGGTSVGTMLVMYTQLLKMLLFYLISKQIFVSSTS
jgi:hypothetical protein